MYSPLFTEAEGRAVLDDGEHGARDDDGEDLEVLRVLWMMQGREVVLVLIVVLMLVQVHDGVVDDDVLVILVLKYCLHGLGGSATAVTLKIWDWARMPVFFVELDMKLNWYPVLIGGEN